MQVSKSYVYVVCEPRYSHSRQLTKPRNFFFIDYSKSVKDHRLGKYQLELMFFNC